MNNEIVRVVQHIFCLLCLLALPLSAQAASFDCGKAQRKIEHLICDNPEISKLDDELSVAYKSTLQDQVQVDSIKQTQKQWLKVRNGCDDAACVKRAYETRLTSLAVLHVSLADVSESAKQKIMLPAQGDNWIYQDGTGENEPLCHDLLNRLNEYFHRDQPLDEQCSWDVITSYPAFTEPSWTELDPRKHKVLLTKLMKYDQEGLDEALNLRHGLKGQNPDSLYRNRADDFIEQGGRLRYWRTPLVQHDGAEQTIAQRWIPWLHRTEVLNRNHGKPCIAKQTSTWLGGGDVVTADISGLDQNIEPATHEIVRRHQLVIYKNKPLLINGKDVWRSGEYNLDHVCSFEFVKGEK